MPYTKRFKMASILKFKEKKSSITNLAQKIGVPKQTLSRWIKNYKSHGKSGLENKKSGAKKRPINKGFENLVLSLWKKKKRSQYKMRKDIRKSLRRNGYSVSERQIQRIYKKHNLQNPILNHS